MHLTGWESVFFYVLGVWALFAGAVVVTARNAVHSALALISALVAVAALFVLLRAEFLAGVQVLVYVGGVMVLFLFVIMLVNVGREARPFARHAAPAVAIVVVLAFAFAVAVERARPALDPPGALPAAAAAAPERRGVSRDTEEVGADLYGRAALPFEIASVLLLVAIVGAVLLARERKHEKMFE